VLLTYDPKVMDELGVKDCTTLPTATAYAVACSIVQLRIAISSTVVSSVHNAVQRGLVGVDGGPQRGPRTLYDELVSDAVAAVRES